MHHHSRMQRFWWARVTGWHSHCHFDHQGTASRVDQTRIARMLAATCLPLLITSFFVIRIQLAHGQLWLTIVSTRPIVPLFRAHGPFFQLSLTLRPVFFSIELTAHVQLAHCQHSIHSLCMHPGMHRAPMMHQHAQRHRCLNRASPSH